MTIRNLSGKTVWVTKAQLDSDVLNALRDSKATVRFLTKGKKAQNGEYVIKTVSHYTDMDQLYYEVFFFVSDPEGNIFQFSDELYTDHT
jgi:hypothetical protein